MAIISVENRLSLLEEEVKELKSRLPIVSAFEPNPWIQQIYDAFKDDLLFEEAVRYGIEWRAQESPAESKE